MINATTAEKNASGVINIIDVFFRFRGLGVIKMSGQVATISTNSAEIRATDQANDVGLDMDDIVDGGTDISIGKEVSGSVKFAKSTDVRRLLEEKLEVKLLKDQLGIDDLGF